MSHLLKIERIVCTTDTRKRIVVRQVFSIPFAPYPGCVIQSHNGRRTVGSDVVWNESSGEFIDSSLVVVKHQSFEETKEALEKHWDYIEIIDDYQDWLAKQ